MIYLKRKKVLIPLAFGLIALVVVLNLKDRNLRPYLSANLGNPNISKISNLVAHGNNSFGQLAKVSNNLATGTEFVPIQWDIKDIAVGRNYSLVTTKEGKVWSWGGNEWGQLGYKTGDNYFSEVPKEIPGLSGIQKVSTSNNHALAIREDGSVMAFGSNFSGQLGTGDNIDSAEPLEVKDLGNVKDIAAGYKFSAALKNDGTVWGWGAMCDSNVKKEAEEWWKTVSVGSLESEEGGYYDPTSGALALVDKNEYCINEDIVGILSRTPIQIKNLEKITDISAGYGHVLALNGDGTVSSFGCNTYKQLGRETAKREDNRNPTRIEGVADVQMVSAGYRHSLVLKKDGTVWGWGLNNHRQLGTDTVSEEQVKPIQLPINDVVSIIAGYDYSIALKKDGTVWAWGMNLQRWFEDSDKEYIETPVQLSRFKDVKKIAASGGNLLVWTDNPDNNIN